MIDTGNFLEGTYKGNKSIGLTDFETIKICTNHIISLVGAKCCASNISNMYLNTVLPSPEYMRIHFSMILNDIKEEYIIKDEFIDSKGLAYFEITKAITFCQQLSNLLFLEDRRCSFTQCIRRQIPY